MPNYFVSGTNTKLLTYFVMLPSALCSHETPMGEAIYFHVYISALLFSKIDIEDLFYMFLLHPAWGLNCLSYEWTNGKTYKAQFGTSEWQFLYVIHLSISQIHPSIYRKIYHFFLLLRQSIYTHYMDYFYFKQSTLYNFNIYAKLFIRLNVSFSRESEN